MCLQTYWLLPEEAELKYNACRNTESNDKTRVWQEAAKNPVPMYLRVLTAVVGPMDLCVLAAMEGLIGVAHRQNCSS